MPKFKSVLLLAVAACSIPLAGSAAAAAEGGAADIPTAPPVSERSLSCEGIDTKLVIYMVIYMVRYGEPTTAPGVEDDCPRVVSA